MSEPLATPRDLARTDEVRRVLEALRRAIARTCPEELSSSRDDLVQAAQVRLLEIDARAEKTSPRSSSYLWQVAYTTVVDEIRRLRRQKAAAEARGGEEPLAPSPRPELRRDIRACLSGLLAARRAAVVLHLEGFGAEEIAAVLKLNPKSAQNLAYRAIADLRRCLRSKGHAE